MRVEETIAVTVIDSELTVTSKNLGTMSSSSSLTLVTESPPLDVESRKGRFGWLELEQAFLPHVFRGDERAKYCSVRAVERVALGPLLHLPGAALQCVGVLAEDMTEAEVHLSNQTFL